MKKNNFHTSFQLNGKRFSSSDEIIQNASNISNKYANFFKEWFSDDTHIIIKTSGSTGIPKNIQLQKAHIINSAIMTGDFFKLAPKTTALCCLPIEFIAGKMMLVRSLLLGWHLDIILPNSNPLASIDKEYEFSAMIPLQVFKSLSKIHLIKKLILGGGVVSSSLIEKLQEVSTQVFATYGMTETITHIAIKKLNNFQITKSELESHYKTLSNVKVSKDSRNCLVIDAPKISSEIIITNDVVEIISQTEFIWKGRYDHIINSGGIKLYPEEIENKLFSKLSNRFFVAGIPDYGLGEKLILIIEGEKIIINNEVFSLLSKFEIPKEIFFISKFIYTETGKIRRKETLRKLSN